MKNKINKLLTLTTIGAISMSGCTSKTIQIMDTKVNKVTVPQVKQERVSKWKSLTNSKKEDCVDCYATISKKSIERVNNMASNSTVVYDYDYSKALSDVDSVNNIKLEEYKNSYLVDESYSDNWDEMSGRTSKTVQIMDTKVNEVTVERVNNIKLEEYKNPYLVDESYSDNWDEMSGRTSKTVQIMDTKVNEVTVERVNNIKLEEYKNPYLVDESYSDNRDESLYAKIENKKLSSKNSIQVGAFRKYAGAKVYAKRYSLLTRKYNVEIKENVQDNRPLYRVQIEGFSNENEAREFMNRYGLNGAFLVRR